MADLIARADEFTLNSRTAQDQAEVRFVALDDGGFVAIWRSNLETDGSAGDFQLVGQRYDASGNPVGGEFDVSGALTGEGYNHTGITLANGQFVVAWEDTTDSTLVARIFNADGSPAGNEFPLTPGPRFDVALSPLENGGFIATWTHFTGTSADAEIRGQIYTAAGQPVGSIINVNATTAGTQVNSDVAGTSDGGFIVVWQDDSGLGGDNSLSGIKMQRFDANGQPVGGEVLVNSVITGAQVSPKIAVLDNGGFVVTWVSAGNGDAGTLMARIYDSSGQPLGAEFAVSSSPSADEALADIVATEGGFFISWSEGITTPAGGDIRGQLFTNSGARVAAETVINTIPTGNQSTPALAVLSSGAILAGWSDDNGTGANGVAINNVEARLFFNPADVITGTDVSERINGTTNNDVISGRLGNDLIYGLAGSDFLNGGRGVDTMYGGAGDDIYVVDHGKDLVYERANEGIDLVQASETHNLRVNVEHLTLIGTRSVNGKGNELDNIITGNSGNNRLAGLDGNDTITGNAGADKLDGGLGDDLMVGGLGNDTFVVDSLGDQTIEAAGEGTDAVHTTTLDWTLGANIERLYMFGTENLDGTGNELANLLRGNDGDNFLVGLGGNDRLIGQAGHDALIAGDGNDHLEGGLGQDVYTGGAGKDWLVFRSTAETGATMDTADQVTDFARGDRFYLATIDADANTAGNQAFTFLGTGAFTGVAGQLRYEQVGSNTFISGDVNGDGVADFMIRVDGLQNFVVTDFVL